MVAVPANVTGTVTSDEPSVTPIVMPVAPVASEGTTRRTVTRLPLIEAMTTPLLLEATLYEPVPPFTKKPAEAVQLFSVTAVGETVTAVTGVVPATLETVTVNRRPALSRTAIGRADVQTPLGAIVKLDPLLGSTVGEMLYADPDGFDTV